MTDYPNWFSMGAEWYFNKHLKHLEGKKINVLQIGAYTGDATVWLMENVLTHPESRLWDVDTWLGSDEEAHHLMDFSDVERVYDEKTSGYAPKLFKTKMKSTEFFRHHDFDYDFIYVDGDHHAGAVLMDALFCLDYLKPGGIIAFDDYTWGENLHIWERPKPAIDAIMSCYADKFEIMDVGSQVWLKRLDFVKPDPVPPNHSY